MLPVTPLPNATRLGFLGSATGAGTSGSSGTATLTFTDATTQTFTLGFTDWASSTLLFSNQIAATMTYRNQSAGQQTLTVYVFAVEVALPAGKTLQSVTLPATVTTGQLHVFSLGTGATLNNLGTSNDNQPGEGNYDTAGRSWSIQTLNAAGLQQGLPFTFNGVAFTWPASYGTLADNAVAAGQTIAVTPVANATTLAFVGSGTVGSPSGTATLTYTDNTTSTFTLGLTDWWATTPSYGNLIVETFNTINVPGGTRPGTYHLYYTETSLTAGKTLKSVTLPTSVSTGQLHIFAIGTRSGYNNVALSDDSNPTTADFDGQGNSYSANDFADPSIAGWNPGDTLTYQGFDYIWPGVPAGQGDNYQANGQTITITPVPGATTLGLVGSASHGETTGSTGTLTLTYTDNSTETASLSLTDWNMHGLDASTTVSAGNHLFALLPHENTPDGQINMALMLFEVEIPLNASKTLRSVTLPATVNQGAQHIFMLATRASNNYPNNVGTSNDSDSLFANLDGEGRSFSLEALEGAGLSEGPPFTFNGVAFTWPASYSVIPDNYQAAGQVLPITPVSGATTLAFLGTSTFTGASHFNTGTATITYTDTTTQTFTLTLTDWWSTTAASGNQIVATCSYINTASGQTSQIVHIYYVDVALQTGKTIQSVTLPTTISAGQMHIFAIGTK